MAKKSGKPGNGGAMRAKKRSKRLEDLPSGRKAPVVKGGRAGGDRPKYMEVKMHDILIT